MKTSRFHLSSPSAAACLPDTLRTTVCFRSQHPEAAERAEEAKAVEEDLKKCEERKENSDSKEGEHKW
jgi:hypothetical protein